MPDRELGAALQAAQILEGEKPLTPIRTLYERYNQSQEAKKLDRLQREIDIWAQEPTQGGVDLQEILDQRHQAERAVKPLRDPIDEQNKDRYPQALGIPRAQLEDLVSQHRSVKEVYQSLRNRLFHWEQAVATTGLSLGSRETDALEVIRRFNEVVSGQVPDYKARNPQEVIAVLRAEFSVAPEALLPTEVKPERFEVEAKGDGTVEIMANLFDDEGQVVARQKLGGGDLEETIKTYEEYLQAATEGRPVAIGIKDKGELQKVVERLYALKEPRLTEVAKPHEVVKTPEDLVRERIEYVNKQRSTGKQVDLRSTDYLTDYLLEALRKPDEPEGQVLRRIMRMSNSARWHEAAKRLALTIEKSPKRMARAEAPASAEIEELKEQIAQLQESITNLNERVSSLEREKQALLERVTQLEEENTLLKKALTNPDALEDEEKARLAELKGEAPPVEEAEEEAAAAVPEAEETVEVEPSTKSAVDQALDELIVKYAPDKEKEGRGRVRGAVLPIIGAVGGGRVAQFAITALEGLGRIPIPGFAAITAGVSSLGASAVRRLVGENAFSLWARYSHTEGGKGRLGKVVKLGQMFARGAERAVLQRALGLTGASAEVQALLALYDGQGNLQLPAQVELGSQTNVEGLVKEGVWYCLGTEAAKQLGAYFTGEEQQQIFDLTRPRILQAINQLLTQNYIPADQQAEFLQRIQRELTGRERTVWTLEAGEVAAIGAAKALTLSQAGIWAAEHLAPRVLESLPQAGVRPPQAAAAEVPPKPPLITAGPAVGLPSVEEAARAAAEQLPQVEEVKALEIQRTLGHTLLENNFKPDWGNLDIWQARFLANDTENPTLWENAAKMARAIVENPEKHLGGLSPETRNTALAAAQRTVAALQEAGYDEETHTLTKAAAVLNDKQKIFDLLHWVRNGQKYFEPVK